MNEIEKLYKNAGIMRRRKCEFYEECPLGFSLSCNDCDIEFRESNSSYPPFTAEKQLELIKWLVHYIKQINITDAISGEFYFTAFGCIGDMKIEFEEALASLVNNLWQDLTEEEKQQIKEMLEG